MASKVPRRTDNTQTGNEDENVFETDIEHAHQHAHDAGNAHVARTLLHGIGKVGQHENGPARGKIQKIHRRVVGDILRRPQPIRQRERDGGCHHRLP